MTYIEHKDLMKLKKVFKELLEDDIARGVSRVYLFGVTQGKEDDAVTDENLLNSAVKYLSNAQDYGGMSAAWRDRASSLFALAAIAYAHSRVEMNRRRVIRQAGEDRTSRTGNDNLFMDSLRKTTGYEVDYGDTTYPELVDLILHASKGDFKVFESAQPEEDPWA